MRDKSLRRWLPLALGIVVFVCCRPVSAAEPDAPDFARDVRPILAKYCFKCHGPDDAGREAGLRLDVREGALAEADSGERAIVPGKPDASEMIARILADDESVQMPPPETKQVLSAEQKEILRRWIAAGAEYQPHWSFQAPQRSALPAIKQHDWPQNAIDHFVLSRLEREGLQPAAPADRYTLVRRVYLDLIGLPPTPEEARTFIDDDRPDAYEQLVDRLLASPAYGERWARRWLDLARYADTNGYEKDRVRSIWPYRDWVIDALNADMPFDQFTIEQLAGDMLPNATLSQQIATGFHRNTMINEEGGIDPLEFRYHAVVDRINTTATTWLGLTLGCAQCHTHKYDPIPHREYYAMMAYLNNADEPQIPVPQPEIAARRQQLLDQIARLEAELPEKFAVLKKHDYSPIKVITAKATGGARIDVADDETALVQGDNPGSGTYTLRFTTDAQTAASLRLEALTDPALPSTGPGRTPHGNFVLTDLKVQVALRDHPAQNIPVKLAQASADFSQQNFPVAHAIDQDPKTGWAIQGSGQWNTTRTATFVFDKPVKAASELVWMVTLDQRFGSQHTLGKFRISVGATPENQSDERGSELFERHFAAWQAEARKQAVRWTVLQPTSASSEVPVLKVLDDHSILSCGDLTKRDVYTVEFATPVPAFTALRLEAIPDDRLPARGPGRIYYEGPAGDFFLSQISATANEKPLTFQKAVHSFASGASTAEKAIDADPQTGWSINGGQGQTHTAIFVLDQPASAGQSLEVQLLFERYYAAGLGRFRLSVSDDPEATKSVSLPADIHEALLVEPAQRSSRHQARLREYFASIAPELAAERSVIEDLRKQLPAFPTTLVMSERPESHPRTTHRMHRGEFLQPKEEVAAAPLSCVAPPLPNREPDRLTFAEWLIQTDNPLTARVTVNRHWQSLMGRGLVRTTDDFGLQGELPSHPELLDWLAIEFMERGWSVKDLHRQIVTSATYRQSARVTPALAERDPQNILLARGPRVRLEAEQIRDYALAVSGLLSLKQRGPSVFPPQPPGVTTEGAYGALAWNVSAGEDRYRRGLYTFAKRTAPYAMLATFDGPSGEACVARRELSNTPLQALVLLNDEAFFEAARQLGQYVAALPGDDAHKCAALFERVMIRPATTQESEQLLAFVQTQRARLQNKELDPEVLAAPGAANRIEAAAWTLVARVLLNLDETVTKE